MKFKTKLISIVLICSIISSQLSLSTLAINQELNPANSESSSVAFEKAEPCSFKDSVLTVNLTEAYSIERLISTNNIDIVSIKSIVVLGFFNEANAKFIKETFNFKVPEPPSESHSQSTDTTSDELSQDSLDSLSDDELTLPNLFSEKTESNNNPSPCEPVPEDTPKNTTPDEKASSPNSETKSTENTPASPNTSQESTASSLAEDKKTIKVPRLDLIDLSCAKLGDNVSINYFDGLESDTKIILPKDDSCNNPETGFSLKELFYSINNGKAMLYEHLKSGAKFMMLKNNDESKKFSITFKTLPSDDTGINHILEHCLFSASTKYNCNSVVHAMLSQFSNSETNAVTSNDSTTYIQESSNKNELLEMAKITIDCIYSPAVLTDKRFFEREGIRYQLPSKDTSINVNSIVYHEMEQNYIPFIDIIFKQLFVGTPFEWYPGGNPKYILDATYDNLKKTYEKYYIPSNSIMFLSGDFDETEICEFLTQLNSEYLSKYSNAKSTTSNALNVNPNSIITYKEAECPGFGKEEFWKPSLIISYVLDNYDYDDNSLNFLNQLIPKGLRKRGYNNATTCCIPVGNKNLFMVSCDNTGKKDVDKDTFKKDFFDTLNYIPENVSPKIFSMFDSSSFDSYFDFSSIAKDFANNDIFNCLKTTSLYKGPLSKDEICSFINSSFLNNKNYCITKLIPKSSFKEDQEALKKRLDAYKNSLSKLEINNLIKSTNDFSNWVDNGSIFSLRNFQDKNLIPKINIEDITIPTSETGILSSKKATWKENESLNNIILGFNTLRVPKDKLVYLTLLMSLAGLNFDYIGPANSENFVSLCDLSLFDDKEFLEPLKNINKIFENDYDLKESLQNIISNAPIFSNLSDSSEVYKPFITLCVYKDSLYSDDFFKFTENLINNIEDKNFIEKLKMELKNVRDLVFCKNNIEKITIKSPSYNKDLLKAKTIKLINSLPDSTATKKDIHVPLQYRGIHAIDKGEMNNENSIAACASYENSQYKFNEDFLVLTKLIQNNFLIPQLRLKGGTYDVQFFVDKKFSLFEMRTSQDADVMNSVKIFKEIPEFLENSNITKNDIDTAIFAVLNDAIFDPQDFFIDCKNKVEIEKIVDSIKSITLEKLKSYIPMLKDIFSKSNIVVSADSETINKNKDLFDRIKTNQKENPSETCPAA